MPAGMTCSGRLTEGAICGINKEMFYEELLRR